jgi:hypothetical protein
MQHRAVALAASMTLLVSGCGLLSSASTTPRPQASLTVNNLSDMPICDVHFAGTGTRLAETEDSLLWFERIEPGASQTFGLDAGRYAMRLCDCDGTVLYGRRRVEIDGSRRLDFRALEVMRRSRSRTRGVAATPARSF